MYEIAHFFIGGSLTTDQLTVLVLGAILGTLFRLNADTSGIRVEVKHLDRRLSIVEVGVSDLKNGMMSIPREAAFLAGS